MNNLTIVEFKNQRVLTSKQLAEQYETTNRRVSENFNRNQMHYQEGKHFFIIKCSELGYTQFADSENSTQPVYLWTEKGCLLQAKSLGTDKAWEVYERLVDTYFDLKDSKPQPQALTTNPYILALIDIDQKQTALKTSLDAVEASQKTLETKVKDLENTIVLGKAFFGPPPVPVAAPTQEPLPLPLLAIAEHPSKQSKPRQRKPKMSKLRKLRVEKGLSSSDVAKIVGISPSHLNHIETGGAVPSYKTLQGIAKALGVTTARVAGYLS